LREAIAVIRSLLAGERTTFDGEVFALSDAGLDFPPPGPVPIYLAGRGPRILRLAGEVADGAVIGGFATEPGLTYALDLIAAGERAAGRQPGTVDRLAWLYTCVSDDVAAARAAVAPMVVASLITSRPILGRLGIVLPDRLADRLEATGWRYPTLSPAEASELVPDEILDAFSLHGTPATCRERLTQVHALGIDHMAFVPFPAEGDTLDRLTQRIATEVVGTGQTLPAGPP
jgi:5,10-methylenetetrahydromethanopterin reductase